MERKIGPRNGMSFTGRGNRHFFHPPSAPRIVFCGRQSDRPLHQFHHSRQRCAQSRIRRRAVTRYWRLCGRRPWRQLFYRERPSSVHAAFGSHFARHHTFHRPETLPGGWHNGTGKEHPPFGTVAGRKSSTQFEAGKTGKKRGARLNRIYHISHLSIH